jgi:peptidoglycan LD-endopeptidase LytH
MPPKPRPRPPRRSRADEVDWLWVVGFVARLALATFVMTMVLTWLLRSRDVRSTSKAVLRYVQPVSELVVPVQGVTRTALRGSFGDPRSENRSHEGIDIFAPRGSAVVAAAPGEIIKVGHDRLGGNVVWMAGAGASLYYYAHLQEFAPGIHAGQDVPSGFFIGRVGTTGNARGTSPHLHFAIYPASNAFRAVDPFPLLRGAAN